MRLCDLYGDAAEMISGVRVPSCSVRAVSVISIPLQILPFRTSHFWSGPSQSTSINAATVVQTRFLLIVDACSHGVMSWWPTYKRTVSFIRLTPPRYLVFGVILPPPPPPPGFCRFGPAKTRGRRPGFSWAGFLWGWHRLAITL